MKALFLKHAEGEGPGTISKYLSQRNIPYETLELWRGDILPRDISGISLVVSLGGPMNVYDEDKYHFLAEEDKFIKKLIEKGIPFLGVCLGAQLLAKAAGAKVYKGPAEEIGWYKVKLAPQGKADPIFKGVSDTLSVFQWHGDTFDIPKNGLLLAEGDVVRNQAFKVGDSAYGFQFHIEVDDDIIKKWFEDSGALGGYLEQLDRSSAPYFDTAHLIYDNLLTMIKS